MKNSLPPSPILCAILSCIPALALAQSAWFLSGPGRAVTLLLLWVLFTVVLIHNTEESPPALDTEGPRADTWILDTSIFIDGRLLELLKLKLIPGAFLVPEFVFEELQHLADRSDKNRRERGRRGLDIASEMQKLCADRWSIYKDRVEGNSVDEKLITLAAHLPGRLASVDKGLLDRASAQGIAVFNMHDCARLLQTPAIPGALLEIKIVKRGENKKQGVGYLDDGTMVVVEGAADFVGEETGAEVTSTIKTRNGPLIFARIKAEEES